MVPSLRQERLTSLKIMPLEKRRIRGDLIETFKILKQMDKVDTSFFFSKATSRYATRGHSMKLFQPALNKILNCRNRKQFFTMRVINHWKELPTHVVNANTVFDVSRLSSPNNLIALSASKDSAGDTCKPASRSAPIKSATKRT